MDLLRKHTLFARALLKVIEDEDLRRRSGRPWLAPDGLDVGDVAPIGRLRLPTFVDRFEALRLAGQLRERVAFGVEHMVVVAAVQNEELPRRLASRMAHPRPPLRDVV